MGMYLNSKAPYTLYQSECVNPYFVDKTVLLQDLFPYITQGKKCLCITRPRRFGKTVMANMISAYFGKGKDAKDLFDKLYISRGEYYNCHLNKYNVISISFNELPRNCKSYESYIDRIQNRLIRDLVEAYPSCRDHADEALWDIFQYIYETEEARFIFVLDEWDFIFHRDFVLPEDKKDYISFLSMLLKDKPYVLLAYMTGILPIKKYGTHSALNMFMEYSMTDPGNLAEYFGFTEEEVRVLCSEYRMDFEEAQAWYDGYDLVSESIEGKTHHAMYSPKSVVESMLRHQYGPYWNQTETYEALKVYIQLNLDGLKDAVVRMMAGEKVMVDISGFSNDMTTMHSADDVFSLLIHLGYLSYDRETRCVSIPNKEIGEVYTTSIKRMEGWSEVARSVEASRKLLQSMWDLDGEAVAKGIDRAHDEISILQYNDENSLSCVIGLAFYFAKEYYTVIREMPSGKGFADIFLIPRPLHRDKPAAVIELKKDKTAEGAIEQIRRKDYVKALEDYQGNLLLVGINYDTDKKHTCVIEKWQCEGSMSCKENGRSS